MITNYIKIGLRSFNRNRSVTFIKILGLALGLAVTFFILIYVSTETSYDQHNVKKERIFRVNQESYVHGWRNPQTPYPLCDGLLNTFPEIESATRIIRINQVDLENTNQVYQKNNLISVDSSFLNMFTLNRLAGDFSSFGNKQNVIITKTAAVNIFGASDVINKTLEMKGASGDILLNIIAVIDDFPATSTIKADLITDVELGLEEVNKRMIWSDGKERSPEFYQSNWSANFVETYVLLNQPENALNFDEKLKSLEEKYLEDTTSADYFIQNLEDIYLNSKDIHINQQEVGDIKSIIIFSAIAFLVLLIACINYIILTISQILNRKKEIGVRKILGANQSHLFQQITIESLMIVLITVPLSFILIEQLRPLLEQIMNKQIAFIYNSKFVLGFLGILMFVVFIPGFNILFFLNRISPISILRKEKPAQNNRFSIKNALIVIQFIIFITLVVLTIGIKKQIDFSTQNDLGFKPENRLVLHVADVVKNNKYSTLKNELLSDPDIESVSGAMWLPPSNSRMSYSYSDTSFVEPLQTEALFVDKDFVETFDLKILEGMALSEFESNAEWKIVVNETFAEILGHEILGKKVWNGEVVGVVNDFRFHSVHEKIQPMMLIVAEYMVREMVVAYKNRIDNNTRLKLRSHLENHGEVSSIEPELLADRFQTLYEKEERMAILVGIFSFIAIFIASIGLLGLTIFTTKKQTKNIAIRKVNGATTMVIWRLLISDFIQLIVVALIIAIPISFYVLNRWLQNFAYKTSIDWWIFAIAGVLAISISLITISWYSLNAARKNPVDSLRYE